MSNKRTEEGLILKLLELFPQGANFKEIISALPQPFHVRKLQRRLKEMTHAGQIGAEGKTKGTVYYLTKPSVTKKPSKGSNLILTQSAQEINVIIGKPLEERKSVGYRREFLDDYIPNSTFYLSESLRKKLFEIGSTTSDKYPAGTYARHIFHRLLIDLSWNSSRLEGNTYSLLETERLLEMGIEAEGKDLKESQMILNHKAAIEFLVESAELIDINSYTLLNLHALLADNLLADAACGRLREIPVGIGKSVYRPPSIPHLIKECFERVIVIAKQIIDPFEQAFFLMVQLPYLQPFEDVNKRTSRLASNIPLIKNNLCPLSFIDVPEEMYINGLLGVYELNRIELLRDVFEWAYERSCFLYSSARNILGEPDAFRMRYRNQIVKIISEIVGVGMNKHQAVEAIKQSASQEIPDKDQPRFIEIVERELQNLHGGSIARYRIKPAEYEAWKANWS